MELLSPSLKIKKKSTLKKFFIFTQKTVCYISEKWNSYISGNGAFKLKKIKKICPEKSSNIPRNGITTCNILAPKKTFLNGLAPKNLIRSFYTHS